MNQTATRKSFVVSIDAVQKTTWTFLIEALKLHLLPIPESYMRLTSSASFKHLSSSNHSLALIKCSKSEVIRDAAENIDTQAVERIPVR